MPKRLSRDEMLELFEEFLRGEGKFDEFIDWMRYEKGFESSDIGFKDT